MFFINKFRVILLASCAAFSALAAPSALSQDASPEETGLRIAEEARGRATGFGNFTARQTMVLRNRQGQESERKLRIKVLEAEDDGNMSLFVFDEPRDVAGTAMLIHTHEDADDDQWLYLPALTRVKRISSSNRSGSFMGSEFAFEDMRDQAVEKFTYRYLRDEPCAELTCTVTERFPVDTRSGYLRQVVWRDVDELRIVKVEYYDRKDAHLKTLAAGNYEQFLGKFWQATQMEMVNHLTGKSTELTWTDFEYGTELNPGEFTQTGLRRVR